MADIPNPFTSGDGPLPTDDSELVAQIKALAAPSPTAGTATATAA